MSDLTLSEALGPLGVPLLVLSILTAILGVALSASLLFADSRREHPRYRRGGVR